MKNLKVSIIVPCYRDAGNIEELYSRLKATMLKTGQAFEVVYVNDCSPDNSQEVLDNLVKREDELVVVSHSRNFGLMGVYNTGLKLCTGDCAVLMDGDLQDPPEVIQQFIEKWLDGYDVVYGISKTRDEKFFRKIGFKLFYRLWSGLTQINIPRDAGDFGLMDRKVIDVINALPEKERFFRGLRAWAGFKQVGVEFHRDDRFSGQTTQSYLKYIGWALLAITSFSYMPLRLISVIAASTTFFSLLWLVSILMMFLFGQKGPEGYTLMISIILIIGSCTLLSLSIIAEYLIRIFNEVKSRPSSVVAAIQKKKDL